ncbi:MAG TPA: periplasmic heavy metal sensor [Candidatus Binatia bacterium]|jgi:uncharacterized membrane protein
MSKKFKLAFLASLLLNVVLTGVFLGQSRRHFDRDARRDQRMDQMLDGLPAEAQSRLREKFAQLRSVAQPLFERIRAAQDEASRALGAEPFDEAVYDRQILEINRLRMEATNRLSKVAKETAMSLPAQERRRFAEMLRRPRPPERKG